MKRKKRRRSSPTFPSLMAFSHISCLRNKDLCIQQRQPVAPVTYTPVRLAATRCLSQGPDLTLLFFVLPSFLYPGKLSD